MEALAAVLSDHEAYYLGKSGEPPESFEAVTWLRRDGFRVGEHVGRYFLTPDRTTNTSFEGAQELHAVVSAVFQDCRSDLGYAWHNTVLERNPVVQEQSLGVLGGDSWISHRFSVVLAGAFGIAPVDPLYSTLLAPPGATELPANTLDMAESRDTSAVPGVDLAQLTDHVLVTLRRASWRVPQWSLGTVLHDGQPVTDHPPMCIVLHEERPPIGGEWIAVSESCRNTSDGP